jgi:hypothetical protein
MTEHTCRHCGANPVDIGGRCLPCHQDHLAAERAREQAQEAARAAAAQARWRGRPIPTYTPQDAHGHGHGTEKLG